MEDIYEPNLSKEMQVAVTYILFSVSLADESVGPSTRPQNKSPALDPKINAPVIYSSWSSDLV